MSGWDDWIDRSAEPAPAPKVVPRQDEEHIGMGDEVQLDPAYFAAGQTGRVVGLDPERPEKAVVRFYNGHEQEVFKRDLLLIELNPNPHGLRYREPDEDRLDALKEKIQEAVDSGDLERARQLYEQYESVTAAKSPEVRWVRGKGKVVVCDAKDWVLPLALLPALSPTPTQPAPQDPAPIEDKAVGWQHYEHLIGPAASQHGVPADLLERLLKTENTTGNPKARSGKGAVGLAQFMPETAQSLGVDPLDPPQAIEGAARYLAALNREFGDWESAVAAYNWGPGNVRRWLARNGPEDEMPAETRKYLEDVDPPRESARDLGEDVSQLFRS